MFERMDLSDKTRFESAVRRAPRRIADLSFACQYIWMHKYNPELHSGQHALYLRYGLPDGLWYTPIGVTDWSACLAELDGLDPAARMGYLTKPDADAAEAAAPGKYIFAETRESADYIYLKDDLALLEGKKYHSKRNFCSRFERENAGNWSYEPLTGANLADAWLFQDSWCRKNGCDGSLTLQEESTAIALLLYNLDNFGAPAGMLKVGGRAVAFTAGSWVTDDTVVVHVEKADYDIPGAYQMICREFAKNSCGGAVYINREDDMGLENLRKAKMSYNPHEIIMKYSAIPAIRT